MSFFLLSIQSTLAGSESPSQEQLTVVEFSDRKENVEEPLISVYNVSLNAKICAAESHWPDKGSQLPMPFISDQIFIESLDEDRNLTVKGWLILIPDDSSIENWSSFGDNQWTRGTNDLYSDGDEDPESGIYLKFPVSDSEPVNTSFLMTWPDYDSNWDGDWPEEAGNYSATLRFEIMETDLLGNWIPADDDLQVVDYPEAGTFQIISNGINCFNPEDEFPLLGLIGCIGIPLFIYLLVADHSRKKWESHSSLQFESSAPAKRSRYISNSVRGEVWSRDRGMCVICQSMDDLQFDHIIPHSRGGSNTAQNLQILCKRCNLAKSDMI
ncbi:MAG: HNH endonuclease [Candidatus Thalassarchaeaceae archaeon]